MKTYTPGPVSDGELRRELASIVQAAGRADPYLELDILHAEPKKVRAGMVVYADGSDWDPGLGGGIYRRSADNERWFSVRPGVRLSEFPGADPTGVANSTSAINTAISLVSVLGGGDVIVDVGRWKLDPFTVPSHVNIVGDAHGPFDGGSSPSASSMAPTFLVNSNSAEFITLNGYKSSVHNILFYYPGQVDPTSATPTSYNYTITIPTGQGGGHVVKGCTFVNSYDAINIGVGRCAVENCIIGAFHRDINVDGAMDWVSIRNVWCQVMWNVYAGLSFPQTIDAWVLNNSCALQTGRVDSLVVDAFCVFGRYAALSFQDSADTGLADRGGYGRLTNIDCDYVAFGVTATSSRSIAGGYKIVNMDVGVNNSGVGTAGQATVITSAGGTDTPMVSWIGGSVRGLWASGSAEPSVHSGNEGNVTVSGVIGINDVGVLTAPAVPSSGVGLVNPFAHRVRIGLAGSITNVTVNGSGIGAPSYIELLPGETIALTYTGSPSWAWFAS